jgi:hypothetical protein
MPAQQFMRVIETLIHNQEIKDILAYSGFFLNNNRVFSKSHENSL